MLHEVSGERKKVLKPIYACDDYTVDHTDNKCDAANACDN